MAGIELGIEGLDECRVIGAGGFATVYSALDVRFGRTVAVKVLANVDEDGRRRFDREQLSMGKLSDHPHVVTAFSSGFTTGGQPYIVMEHLSGGSLADIIDRDQTVPWDRAVRYVTAIAKALGHAHSQGVLHRDVKPENILLSPEGTAKLADFGISTVREGVATQAVGFSLAHAPPETFRDGQDNRDERSDLYSLASSLLTVVRGQAPYESPGGNSQMAYMMRITDHPIPQLGDIRYDNFLAIAMAKDPADRFQDADEFIDALATTLLSVEDQPPLTPPASRTITDSSLPTSPPGSEQVSEQPTESVQFDEDTRAGDRLIDQPTTDGDIPPATEGDSGDEPGPQDSTGSPNLVESDSQQRDNPELDDSESDNPESDNPELDNPESDGQSQDDVRLSDQSANVAESESGSREAQASQSVQSIGAAMAQPSSATVPRLPGSEPDKSNNVQVAELEATPKKFRRKEAGLFESADTIIAEREPPTESIQKERQKGIIVAAVIGLIALALFLVYLLRPSPQNVETTSSRTIAILETEQEPETEEAATAGRLNEAAGVIAGPHTDAVTQLTRLGPTQFISVSDDGTVLVWDASNEKLEPTGFTAGADLTITHSLPLSDGRVVSRRSDDAALIWDPANVGDEPLTLKGRAGEGGLAETESGLVVSVNPSGKALSVWDSTDVDNVTVIAGDDSVGPFEPTVKMAVEGNSVITASTDHQLTLWTIDGETGGGTVVPDAFGGSHTSTINDLLVLSDGTVASASDDGSILLQRPEDDGDEVIIFDEHPKAVLDLVQFEDGRIGSGGTAASVVWNPENPKWVQDQEKTGLISRLGRTTEQAILPDQRLAIASFKEVVVWDPNLPSSSPIATKSSGSKTHDGNVTAILALDDGRLVSADDKGAVLVWDPDNNS